MTGLLKFLFLFPFPDPSLKDRLAALFLVSANTTLQDTHHLMSLKTPLAGDWTIGDLTLGGLTIGDLTISVMMATPLATMALENTILRVDLKEVQAGLMGQAGTTAPPGMMVLPSMVLEERVRPSMDLEDLTDLGTLSPTRCPMVQ